MIASYCQPTKSQCRHYSEQIFAIEHSGINFHHNRPPILISLSLMHSHVSTKCSLVTVGTSASRNRTLETLLLMNGWYMFTQTDSVTKPCMTVLALMRLELSFTICCSKRWQLQWITHHFLNFDTPQSNCETSKHLILHIFDVFISHTSRKKLHIIFIAVACNRHKQLSCETYSNQSESCGNHLTVLHSWYVKPSSNMY